MFGFLGREGHPALLWSTIKATAAIIVLATFATAWLSSETIDRGALARIALSGLTSDPATTGSIAQAANAAKLDPCTRQRNP